MTDVEKSISGFLDEEIRPLFLAQLPKSESSELIPFVRSLSFKDEPILDTEYRQALRQCASWVSTTSLTPSNLSLLWGLVDVTTSELSRDEYNLESLLSRLLLIDSFMAGIAPTAPRREWTRAVEDIREKVLDFSAESFYDRFLADVDPSKYTLDSVAYRMAVSAVSIFSSVREPVPFGVSSVTMNRLFSAVTQWLDGYSTASSEQVSFASLVNHGYHQSGYGYTHAMSEVCVSVAECVIQLLASLDEELESTSDLDGKYHLTFARSVLGVLHGKEPTDVSVEL